jgi:hypothetical protein
MLGIVTVGLTIGVTVVLRINRKAVDVLAQLDTQRAATEIEQDRQE